MRAWKRNGTPRALRAPGEHRFIVGSPKTRLSVRTVALAAPIVDLLRVVVEGKGSEDLVFTAPGGGPWRHPDFYRGRWQVAVAAARLAGLGKTPRFHDLRHTHAVWLITAGVPLPVVQARLGHDSIQMTVDIYGGFLGAASAAADQAIAAALTGGLVQPALRLLPVSPGATAATGGTDPATPVPTAG
jgi:integrase